MYRSVLLSALVCGACNVIMMLYVQICSVVCTGVWCMQCDYDVVCTDLFCCLLWCVWCKQCDYDDVCTDLLSALVCVV